MQIRFIAFLITFFLSPSFAFCQNEPSTTANEPKGRLVSDSRIANPSSAINKGFGHTPSWDPEKEESAPFAVNEAVKKGWENLKNFSQTRDKNWTVHEVDLTHIGSYKWTYTIEFYCFQEGCNPDLNHFVTVIKMDGTTYASKINSTKWNISNPGFENRIDFTYRTNGNEYWTKATLDDLVNTQSWIPETGNAAPLSLTEAMEIGQGKIKQLMPGADYKLGVYKVIWNHLGKNKWVYQISFYCNTKECSFRHFDIFIKMDGTIVEPRINACN